MKPQPTRLTKAERGTFYTLLFLVMAIGLGSCLSVALQSDALLK